MFQVITDPELRERHLGDLQGLVLREAAELKPDAYLASLSPRTDQEIPVRHYIVCSLVEAASFDNRP